MTISCTSFGRTPDGHNIEAYHLSAGNGTRATILTYGAALQSLSFENGPDIVLGFDTLDGYLDNPGYIGVAIGRVANRIRGGQFSLDQTLYQLPKNDGANNLHSGPHGFDHVIWRAKVESVKGREVLTLSHICAEGTNGFPGTLKTAFQFTLSERSLDITMTATTDRPTVCNLTHHTYFNLEPGAANVSGPDISTHMLRVLGDQYTPTDSDRLPLGTLEPVKDSSFDFTTSQALLQRAIDHNYVVGRGEAVQRLKPVVKLGYEDKCLEVQSTLPGVQIYTGDGLEGQMGKSGTIYGPRTGIAIEPQYFPDAPNCPAFETIVLRAGDFYSETIRYIWHADGRTSS